MKPVIKIERKTVAGVESNPGEIFDGGEVARSKAEERQQKLSKIRYKQYKRLFLAVLFIASVLFGFYELYHSSFLDIKEVKVNGAKYVDSEIVKKKCDVSKPINILRAPTSEIRQNLLKDPWIKSAKVSRVFPNILQVDIKERIPIAMVSIGSRFYIVDKDSFTLSSRGYSDGLELPVIADLPVSKVKTGDRIINPSLRNAITCLISMDRSFRKTINLVSASSVDKLSLYNKENIEILYGDAEFAQEKNEIISTILKKQGEQVIFIDVRSYPQTDPVLRRLDAAP